VKENMKEDDKDNDANFLFQTYKTVTNRNTWFLDPGATNYACCSEEAFETLKTYNSSIKVGDGRSLDVIGTGSINLKVNST